MHSALILLGAALLALLILSFSFRWRGLCARGAKALAVLVFLLAISRHFFSDSFIYVINGGWFSEVYYEEQDTLQLLLRWGLSLSAVVVPLAAFLDSRFFKNVAVYITLPLAVVSSFFYDDFMAYFLAPNPRGYSVPPIVREILFTAELVLAVAIPLMIAIGEKHVFRFGSLREWRGFLLGVPAALLAVMPAYAPQALFGYDVYEPTWFSPYHLAWMAFILVVTLSLYYLFRFRSYRERYCLLLFLALALFYQYHSLYLMGVTLKRLPLQLCNIAAYFNLFAVLFRNKSFFHFCFLANITGALIAVLVPDFSLGTIGFWNMHFLIEHSYVVLVPALGMGLRLFPRLTPKSFLSYFIGFTVYFLSVFALGTVMNGYSDITNETVNYFYLFDHELAFEYFPFLTFTEKYYFTFGRFVVYPVLVSIVYVAFTLLVLLFYLAVRFFYKMEDDHLALRRAGIELKEQLFKRPSRRPKYFID